MQRGKPLRRVRDGGYVLALGALLMVPLVGFTALAVDLGAWISRATAMENAAEAAALGGVVYLPDDSAATLAAQGIATRNGFTNGVDDITVTVTPLGAQRLQVTIRDDSVDQYFSSILVGDVDIERKATSEYVLPVRLGSPSNFLGTGNDPVDRSNIPTARHENFWLAASGQCASRENGDFLLPITDANYDNANNPGPPGMGIGWGSCTGGTTEDLTVPGGTHDADGYYYAIEVPESYAGTGPLTVQLYDAPQCSGGTNPTGDGGGTSYTTSYKLLPWDSTPYRPSDNLPALATRTFTTNQSNASCGTSMNDWEDKWVTLGSPIANPQPGGIYFVQVQTLGGVSAGVRHTSNSFSLRASLGGGVFAPCTGDSTDTLPGFYDANCPNVFGLEYMSIFGNLASPPPPEFFLSDVAHEHSGKKFEITLFDPGEGARALEILDPLGRSVSFDWDILDEGGDTAPTGGWSGTVTQAGGVPCTTPATCSRLDVLGNDPLSSGRGWNPQRGPYFGSRSKYSDRQLEITIDLPADIQTEYSGRTWWKVRYTLGGGSVNITDRTTWSARVSGDPVRIIPSP